MNNSEGKKTTKTIKLPGASAISCQKCGRIRSWGFSADMVINCERCGSKQYVFLDKKVMLTLPEELLEDPVLYTYVQQFTHQIKYWDAEQE